MTKEIEVAPKPYGPPFAIDRAWAASQHDGWILDAARDGFIAALQAAVLMDERDPEMRKTQGVEIVRFRSNRISGSRAIDSEIVMRVMDMDDQDIAKTAQYRREHSDELTTWPRECLDLFAQDLADAVDDAGQYDRQMAQRWANARYEMEKLAAPWLGSGANVRETRRVIA